MIIVNCLRFRRAKCLRERHGFSSRESFSSMSTDVAQAILKDLTELEFPKIFGFSIIFALFKVRSALCRNDFVCRLQIYISFTRNFLRLMAYPAFRHC